MLAMDYLNAFWVGGLICALVQILMEKTKLMPGRIMVLLVCIMTPDLRRGRHCFFALNVHLVFVTKYRRSIFTDEHLMTIRASAEKVCGDFGASLREFNGERNHVHLLVSYPPKVSISSLVNSLKGVTSRILRNKFPELETSCCKGKL